MPSPSPSLPPPNLPSLNLSSSLLRQIRTLLLCSTTPQEHLADLHLTPHPTATYQISTLSLPPSSTPSSPSTRLVPLTPTPTPPRPTQHLSLPLSASATLTPSSTPALTLHAHARTFRYALDAPVPFAARDPYRFAQSALGIVLTGGATLHEGDYMGVLRVRNMGHGEVLEAVTADAEGDAGVWLLGGGQCELWEALNGLAERLAKRRNRRLGRKDIAKWVAREIVVIQFSERGDAVVRRGWIRVLCGKEGVERYYARMLEGGEGRFVREISESRANSAEAQSLRAGEVEHSEDGRRTAAFVPRRRARAGEKLVGTRREQCHERLDVDSGKDRESGQIEEARSSEEREPDMRVANSGDEEETMNVMCLKYLCSSYANEVKRHMDTQA